MDVPAQGKREKESTLAPLSVHLGPSTHTDKDRPPPLGLYQMFCPHYILNLHPVCRVTLQALPRCRSISCCPSSSTPPSLMPRLTSSASLASSASSLNSQRTMPSPPRHPLSRSKQPPHPSPKAQEGDSDKQHGKVAAFKRGPTGKSGGLKQRRWCLSVERSLKEGVSRPYPLYTTVTALWPGTSFVTSEDQSRSNSGVR